MNVVNGNRNGFLLILVLIHAYVKIKSLVITAQLYMSLVLFVVIDSRTNDMYVTHFHKTHSKLPKHFFRYCPINMSEINNKFIFKTNVDFPCVKF